MILFDVDGTLLVTGGATSRCIRRACVRALGQDFKWADVTPGLLDPQIFDYLAVHNGYTEPGEYHDRYRAYYLQELEAELDRRRRDVVVLPGVRELLTALSLHQQQGRVVLGLLTGNYGHAMKLKLRAADIDLSQFPIRACAEDGHDRSDLVSAAIHSYAEHTAHSADPRRIIIVGDTPRDIACAHTQGCTAFAVATGWYSTDALQQAGADHVVEDFSSPELLLKLLVSQAPGDTI
jgi:phosphoglycolate phosphatase-like HAD superfamily hydrolase